MGACGSLKIRVEEMKIAVVQFNPRIGHLKSNVEKIKGFIGRAKEDGADLIVFPELAVTGYHPRDLLFYNAFLDGVEKAVTEDIVPLAEGIVVVVGTPWREKEGDLPRLYNAALVLKDKKIISSHYKILLSGDDVFDEHRYFKPGAKTSLLTLGGKKIAVTIGDDLQLEEHFRQGPGMVINLAASPYHLGRAGERAEMFRSLAMEKEVCLFYVNQVGGNDELIFDGSCVACSESAKVFHQVEPFRETLLYCKVDNFDLEIIGVEEDFPSLRTRNYLQEEDVNWVYAALQRGLADYLKKTGFDKVIIGMSGGIDSAVIAALAVEILGPDKVLSVMMPSRYSTDHSISDSEKLAANLQMENRLIPIEGPFKEFIESLNRGRKAIIDLAEENLQARIRGDILMFISNRESGMVLTTGNKSELAVGYCTLYGDMCGGLAVLADVPKQMVYRLAAYINDLAGKELIPQSIITKPPSAELRPDQFDHDSLPPYEVLDRLVHYYIEKNMHVDEIVAMGFEREQVENIVAKIDRSEYKRFQAAPVLRITSKAFGSGRRIPLARGNFW
jgi:NAD+ synthase (glutamine-hydrolysing)